jgi:hypothetical protein
LQGSPYGFADWRNSSDNHSFLDAFIAVTTDIASDFTAAHGMADHCDFFQVELFQQFSKIICEGVIFIAGSGLLRTAVPTPVVRNHAVAILAEEKHLRIPRVSAQRPAARKNDRRSRAPIFIEN